VNVKCPFDNSKEYIDTHTKVLFSQNFSMLNASSTNVNTHTHTHTHTHKFLFQQILWTLIASSTNVNMHSHTHTHKFLFQQILWMLNASSTNVNMHATPTHSSFVPTTFMDDKCMVNDFTLKKTRENPQN